MESSSSVKDTSEVIMPNTDNSMSTDEIDSYNDPLFVSNIPNGAYKWNKQNFCKFCKKGVIKMSRHLKHVHKDEDDVRKMNALPRKSEEKRQIQEQLRREGNYKYNKVYDATKDSSCLKPDLVTRNILKQNHTFHVFTAKDSLGRNICINTTSDAL